MLIGIDGNEANIENRVGVNVYAFELLKTLRKLEPEWGSKHRLIVYLKNRPLADMPKATSKFGYKIIPGAGMWIVTKLMPNLFLDKARPDIFFAPSHYIPPFAPMPTVCSIMDLGYLEFSGQFKKSDFWQLTLWSAWSINISKALIAISNSTKQDIVRHYPSASKKIVVTYLGYDRNVFNPSVSKEDVRRVSDKYSIVGDYILFLSTLKPSKNVERLVSAFNSVIKDGELPASNRLQLVIAGKKGWLYNSIFKKVQELGLENKVIFTDFVPEADKPGLIAGAKVFVLPSYWEGFGHDVLNAMAVGTPAVVSRAGSLPEVAGEAGIYVDPADTASIARGILKVLSLSKVDYNKLVAKGFAQAAKFSWEKTARETLAVLEKVKK